MKIISIIAIVLAVIAGILCIISRLTLTPFAGIESQAMAMSASILLLLSIAINTLK